MADPIRQLLSQTSYTANGTDTVWNFSFAGGYLDPRHVRAQYKDATGTLIAIPLTEADFVGPYQLLITPAIPAGCELTIYRNTPKDLPLVDWADKAVITEASLDLNAKQAIFVAAESSDYLGAGVIDAETVAIFTASAVSAASIATAKAASATDSAASALDSKTVSLSSAVNAAASEGVAIGKASAADASATEAEASNLASGASAVLAAVAKTAAEAARDAAQLSAGVYASTAAGIAATTTTQYFSVPSAASSEYLILYYNNAGAAQEIKRYYSLNALEPDFVVATYELSFRDPLDNVALGITTTGEVEIPKIKVTSGTLGDVTITSASVGGTSIMASSSPLVEWAITDVNDAVALGITAYGGVITPGTLTESVDIPGMAYAMTDPNGNMVMGVKDSGELVLPGFTQAAAPTGSNWQTLSIGADDSIVHIGDSYTASHYTVKDKSYISQLAALSPYRHQNFGVSGNDALDMQYRIVNQSDFSGMTFKAMKPKYAFITTHTNDSQFRTADLSYYAENVRRLIETVKGEGVEPILTTEFDGPMADLSLLRRIADEYKVGFIDCTGYDAEANGLDYSMFHQGHPGTRTNGVFWLPMLDFIDKMPKPEKAIKVFRRRASHAVGAISDLLYKGRADRSKRWQELSVAHYSLDPENKYDELSQLGTGGYFWQTDEYQKLALGQAVAFTDYTLIELTLPGTALNLEVVEVTLGAGTSPAVYARDFLDVTASMPGRAQGSAPADATYLSKWDKPRGAWRLLGSYVGPITIPKADLRKSMQGDKLVLMVAGAFSLTGLSVRYQGGASKPDPRQAISRTVIGAELLTQPLCGTSGQLAAWTQAGTPTVLVPIDVSNAPRKPGTNSPVDGACTISASNTIGQTVTLSAETGLFRRYRLTAWVRYFPKAWLDTTLYTGLDPNQVIDRIANPTLAPITAGSFDLRTLKCEVWAGASYPTAGGAEYTDFAPLWWRPIEFVIDAPAYRTGASISFRLSCPDGEVQVSKVSFKEVSL